MMELEQYHFAALVNEQMQTLSFKAVPIIKKRNRQISCASYDVAKYHLEYCQWSKQESDSVSESDCQFSENIEDRGMCCPVSRDSNQQNLDFGKLNVKRPGFFHVNFKGKKGWRGNL